MDDRTLLQTIAAIAQDHSVPPLEALATISTRLREAGIAAGEAPDEARAREASRAAVRQMVDSAAVVDWQADHYADAAVHAYLAAISRHPQP